MSMIDPHKWTPTELFVFAEYKYLCVLCMFQYADTLHHEPPRSLNPKWKDEPWTQYPVCNAHHEALTVMSREEAQATLDHHVDIVAPGAIRKIKENYYAARSAELSSTR